MYILYKYKLVVRIVLSFDYYIVLDAAFVDPNIPKCTVASCPSPKPNEC